MIDILTETDLIIISNVKYWYSIYIEYRYTALLITMILLILYKVKLKQIEKCYTN